MCYKWLTIRRIAFIAGLLTTNPTWLHSMVVVFIVIVCFVTLVQCFSGSDVLRWRSFYTNENKAWKRHYREVFDHGIREALCCLGRVKYLYASAPSLRVQVLNLVHIIVFS